MEQADNLETRVEEGIPKPRNIREWITYLAERSMINHPNIIYVAKRIGKEGKEFNFYKGRTMEYGADLPDERTSTGKNGRLLNEEYVIPKRRILRMIKWDELPQIINWIKGDIKFMGPRPVPLSEFQRSPKQVQEFLRKYGGGLIPPVYYSLNANGYKDKVDSNLTYLERFNTAKSKIGKSYVDYCVYSPRCLANLSISITSDLSGIVIDKIKKNVIYPVRENLTLEKSKVLNKLASLF